MFSLIEPYRQILGIDTILAGAIERCIHLQIAMKQVTTPRGRVSLDGLYRR